MVELEEASMFIDSQVEINQEQAQAVAEYQDTIQVLETERLELDGK